MDQDGQTDTHTHTHRLRDRETPDRNIGRLTHRQTYRQTQRQADSGKGSQTPDRQTDRHEYRLTDRQTQDNIYPKIFLLGFLYFRTQLCFVQFLAKLNQFPRSLAELSRVLLLSAHIFSKRFCAERAKKEAYNCYITVTQHMSPHLQPCVPVGLSSFVLDPTEPNSTSDVSARCVI